MDTTALNVGCGLIATAPAIAGHFIFCKTARYILLTWFCSFICTTILVICSLCSLFTTNPWVVMLVSIPLETLGKLVLKYIGCKQRYLRGSDSKMCMGLCLGLGFALSHVLTLFLPFVFDQPYSVDFDANHPKWFPNSLDLAIGYHCLSLFQISSGILLFRFSQVNILISGIVLFALHMIMSSITQIPIVAIKLILLVCINYSLVIYSVKSFKGFRYAEIEDHPDQYESQKQHGN